MKLKTKFQDKDFSLGEVADVNIATMPDGRIKAQAVSKSCRVRTFFYEKLETFLNDWENYEEPKEYWTIDRSEKGGLFIHKVAELSMLPEWVECDEKYGIRFETEEEAEQAVKKLKAFKRLKDKGFRFTGIAGLKSEIHFCADEKYDNAHIMFDEYGSSSDDLKQYNKDLDLLFSGEDD